MSAAMMADSIEHVISYWVIFNKFSSPELGGFAVIAHWLPFLLFSIWTGALADGYDPRRMIQLGMVLFMGVSVAWGVLFVTDTLQMWHACVLLVLHGLAGVLWNPPAQVLLHDIVAADQLQSAVRLTATARYLGLLLGPALGGGILLLMGPSHGILFNALLYLPTILWLWQAPYGPKFRTRPVAPRAIRGFMDILSTFGAVASDRTIVSMLLLSGGAALFVGNAYQAQLPGFAHDLGHGEADFAYTMLLGADAAGALFAGLMLESRGLLRANPRTALILALLWCVTLTAFAVSRLYVLSLVLLFIAGFVELSFNSMAQTLVQLRAPADIRGRVIGAFSTSAFGMRTISGVSVGVVGGLIGIHTSLALSALFVLAMVLGLLTFRLRPAAAPD